MLASSVLADVLAWWVTLVARRPWWTLLLCTLLSAAAWQYTRDTIGINTDTADMISPDLPWRQRYIDFREAMPDLGSTLTVVIDGPSVEAAEDAARRLAERLAEATEVVASVRVPGLDPFFRRNGLLFLEVDELQAQADRLVAAQPVLGRLAASPELLALLELLTALGGQDLAGQAQGLARLMRGLADAMRAAGTPAPDALSWQALLSTDAPEPAQLRQFVLVDAHLDYSRLLPAGPVLRQVREAALALQLAEHGVRVRITGATAMEHEELQTVSAGMGVAGAVALALVTLVLLVGLRSWRAMLAVMVTLLMGLLWTAAFAAFAVGNLNLISVAFAVLYIGLGVDYAVHYCLRLGELRAEGAPSASALEGAARDVGSSLVLCALTTGLGFYAFVPTDFAGVSELGLISGTGMFISLAASLTVLPALLQVLPPAARAPRTAPLRRGPRAPRSVVLVAALVAGAAAAATLPFARFDHNPVHLRDAQSESVATYLELLEDGDASPWTLSALGDGTELAALAERLRELAEVHDTRLLSDFVPPDQDDKLLIIDDLVLALGPTLVGAGPQPLPGAQAVVTPAALGPALAQLGGTLQGLAGHADAELAAAARRLAQASEAFVARLAAPDGAALAADLERRVLVHLPALFERIDTLTRATAVTLDDLPGELRERWVASDGRWRLEVAPAGNLDDNQTMARFVTAVQAVVPAATGTPEVHLGAARVVVRAFVQAFGGALLLLVVSLWLLSRRWLDVAQVLAPLLLAMLLTVAAMVLLGIPFNFANVIALPLLLGIGVDNGIHMVHRAHGARPAHGNLLATSTARGIVLSAVTTACGFGNLAYSPHPGTASMGQVLSLGLGVTVLTTLLVLPALLETPARRVPS